MKFDEIKNLEMQVKLRNEQIEHQGIITDVSKEINDRYEEERKVLNEDEDFKNISKEVVIRSAKASIEKDMLAIMSQEHINELSAYLLKVEKDKLDTRVKQERKVIFAEVEAEVMERKINALKKRYGYLYAENEKFVGSKKYNQFKEIENWWTNTSATFRKVITGSMKLLIWGVLAFLIIYFGYQGIEWLMSNYQIVQPMA